MSLGVKIGIAILFVIIAALPPLAYFAAKKKANHTDDKTSTVVTAVYHKISPSEAKEWMDADKAVILADVRTREEYDQGRIAGSILLPLDDIAAQATTKLPDKNTVIIVYCRSGARSQKAAKQLVALGYTGIYDMGGILSWSYGTVK